MTRLLCVVEAPIIYLFQTVWPFGLSFDYRFPTLSSWPVFALGLLLIAGMIAVCWRWLVRPGRWTGLGAFAVAWLYVGLLPMIGIVGVGYEPHSDRYTYWIGCGAAVCCCMAATWGYERWKRYERVIAAVTAAVLVGLSALTVIQSLPWRDTTSLFVDTTRKSGEMKFFQAAFEIMEQAGGEEIPRAEALLRRNLAEQGTPRARAWLAIHLAVFTADDRTRTEEALAEARRLAREALEEDPKEYYAEACLAYADYREGHYEAAYEQMKAAMEHGYVSHVVVVDENDWKGKAMREKEGKADVQR